MRFLLLLLLTLLLTLLLAFPAAAHETRPAYLELIEQRPGDWAVTWKQPVMGDQAVRLEPQLSNRWLAVKPASEELTSAFYLRRWQIRAPAAQLAGARLTVAGLDRSITDVLVHASTAQGKRFDAILDRDRLSTVIDFGRGAGLAVRAYLGLGLHHILAGIDHLLFVLGLVLLVGFNWRLVGVITSFTVGHSLTLAASTLGFVHAPVAVIEALVALSIVFVARELLCGGQAPLPFRGGDGGGACASADSPHPNPSPEAEGLARRKPWAIALIFGLLHGFAFAGALAETGLPQDEIPLALLLFNLGVEAGQLLFVAALGIAALGLKFALSPSRLREGLGVGESELSASSATAPPPPPPASGRGENWSIHRLAPYAMGCYAGFLFVERAVAAFA